MRIFFTLSLFCFFTFSVTAQNFNGQWKGGFTDNSTSFMGIVGPQVDYVLELECNGSEINGYSYTYFTESGKRYYTICKLSGTINRVTREIIVTEFERTKFNTPPDFRNCFQTHRLKYSKENSDTEALVGTWVPAPNQTGDCGYGRTTLTRKVVRPVAVNNEKKNTPPPDKKDQRFSDMNRAPQKQTAKQTKPVTKPPVNNHQLPLTKNDGKKPVQQQTVRNDPPQTKPAELKRDTVVKQPIPVTKLPSKKTDQVIVVPDLKFEKRINSIQKTIAIKNETFTVDFYDNGEIDGDSISVFFNGKLILSHQMLSYKAIEMKLTIDQSRPINELVMYAENLGSIPPNTALMIVHDGDNRYEQRIESDLGKNGTIRFTYKPKDTP